MKLFCTLRTRAAVLASVLAMASGGASAAPTGSVVAGHTSLGTTASVGAPVALNLLSGPRASQPRVHVRTLGSGRWVCSPAGSGQRSRCYRN